MLWSLLLVLTYGSICILCNDDTRALQHQAEEVELSLLEIQSERHGPYRRINPKPAKTPTAQQPIANAVKLSPIEDVQPSVVKNANNDIFTEAAESRQIPTVLIQQESTTGSSTDSFLGKTVSISYLALFGISMSILC